jgi:hypothetical protein
MPKLFGVHPITLKEGVTAAQFEEFLRTDWRPFGLPGVRDYVVKGERGTDAGSYLRVLETDLTTRNRYWPAPGETTSEFTALWEALRNTPEQRRSSERWSTFAMGAPSPDYTDWVVVAE